MSGLPPAPRGSMASPGHVAVGDAAGPEVRTRIRREILAAQRAGARDEKVEPLTASQIDAPLSLTEGPVDPTPQLRIRGYLVEAEISRGGQASVFSAVHEAT